MCVCVIMEICKASTLQLKALNKHVCVWGYVSVCVCVYECVCVCVYNNGNL